MRAPNQSKSYSSLEDAAYSLRLRASDLRSLAHRIASEHLSERDYDNVNVWADDLLTLADDLENQAEL